MTGKWAALATRADASIRAVLSGKAGHRWFVAAVLAATVILRVVLVEKGGQHFFFDETKLSPATESARLLSTGDLRGALVYAVEPHPGVLGDHFGFKVAGILPELIENRFGRNDHIPALYFSIFSALSVLLLAEIAFRLSGSRRAFDITLVTAAASAVLLIYSRFLLPYDLSLCVALLAIWLGVKRQAGFIIRSGVVGALAAWTFFCYFGYWPLAGTVVLVHALWTSRTVATFSLRLVAAGAGSVAVVLAVLGISHLGHGTLFKDIAEVAGLQAGGAADFRASWNCWLYLFYAERMGIFLWVAAFAAGLWVESRERPQEGGPFMTPLRLMAAGFLVIYAVFVINSDLRHSLIVCGRHIRQLAPFAIVGFGLGLDRICARRRWGDLLAAAVACVLVGNSFWTFSTPLTQEFPRDFMVRARALLKGLPAIEDGSGYYRMVNVDHFFYEPEILRDPPMETLLASRHPLEYLPYLYDIAPGREMKRLRLSIDHRMRLVRMAVPEAERVHGDPYGKVMLSLKFPDHRAGYSEPLLSVGPRGSGDLFFVNFSTPRKAQIGFISIGVAVIRSESFDFVPGERRVLELASGSLMPPEGSPTPGLDTSAAAALRQSVYAAIDGKVLLDEFVVEKSAKPGDVFAGVNAVEADSAGSQFSGRILGVNRGGWPPVPKGIGKEGSFGAVHLRIQAPPVSAGTAEPLLVAGIPGRAVLGFQRIYPDGTTSFGVEIWGTGAFEGKQVHLDLSKPLEIVYSFGALYPPLGSPNWGGLSGAGQLDLKHHIRITVNDQVMLDLEKDTPDLADLPVFYAKNPVGGSLVNAGYSGRLLLEFREPIGEPPAR
jgi:hypothetical protein